MSPESVHTEMENRIHTSISRSKVYGLLRRLWQLDWVHRYYNNSSQSHHSINAINWGAVEFNESFNKAMVELEGNYIRRELFPAFLKLVENTVRDLNREPALRKWIPQRNDICRFDGYSHEADEFFSSILDIATSEFVDSK